MTELERLEIVLYRARRSWETDPERHLIDSIIEELRNYNIERQKETNDDH